MAVVPLRFLAEGGTFNQSLLVTAVFLDFYEDCVKYCYILCQMCPSFSVNQLYM